MKWIIDFSLLSSYYNAKRNVMLLEKLEKNRCPQKIIINNNRCVNANETNNKTNN